MDASRDTSTEITKELPSVAVVEGWPQRRTKNHIQPQLPPFSNEFSTVNLEGKTEEMTNNVCWTAAADQCLQHGKRKKNPFLDTTEKSKKI